MPTARVNNIETYYEVHGRGEPLELEGAGHGFLAEKAEEANAAVLDFLRPHRSGGSPK